MSHVITKEFQKKFNDEITVNPLQAVPLSKDIMEANNDLWTKDVLDEEILEVVKQYDFPKTPNPDRMQDIFYQKYWDVVGKFVCKMVKFFFNSNHAKRN